MTIEDIGLTRIETNKCTRCGGCIDLCPTIDISMINDVVTVGKELCTGCSMCIKLCPPRAPYEEKEYIMLSREEQKHGKTI